MDNSWKSCSALGTFPRLPRALPQAWPVQGSAGVGGVQCRLGIPCVWPPPLQDFLLPLIATLAASNPTVWPLCLLRLGLSPRAPAAPLQVERAVASARRWGTLTSTALSFKGWFPDVSTCFYSLPNAVHVSCMYFVRSVESSSAGGVRRQSLCWGNSGIRAPEAPSL